jgi:hypothetical protein
MAGWLRLAGLAAAAAMAGCRVPPPDLSRDPAELLAAVRAAQGRVARVQGSAKVHVDSPEVSGWVDEFVAAEKPDRVRLETRDFFGNVAAVLVADGGRFALYDARQRVYYRGEATPENVSRLLPLALPPADLAVLLCGSAPLVEGPAREVEARGARLLLRLGGASAEQELAVGEEAAVEASRVRRPAATPAGGGGADHDLEFDTFRRRGGIRFPTAARLAAPAAGVRLELRWKEDLEVNGPPDPALFRLEPPRGARVVDLAPGSSAPPVELPARPDPR